MGQDISMLTGVVAAVIPSQYDLNESEQHWW